MLTATTFCASPILLISHKNTLENEASTNSYSVTEMENIILKLVSFCEMKKDCSFYAIQTLNNIFAKPASKYKPLLANESILNAFKLTSWPLFLEHEDAYVQLEAHFLAFILMAYASGGLNAIVGDRGKVVKQVFQRKLGVNDFDSKEYYANLDLEAARKSLAGRIFAAKQILTSQSVTMKRQDFMDKKLFGTIIFLDFTPNNSVKEREYAEDRGIQVLLIKTTFAFKQMVAANKFLFNEKNVMIISDSRYAELDVFDDTLETSLDLKANGIYLHEYTRKKLAWDIPIAYYTMSQNVSEAITKLPNVYHALHQDIAFYLMRKVFLLPYRITNAEMIVNSGQASVFKADAAIIQSPSNLETELKQLFMQVATEDNDWKRCLLCQQNLFTARLPELISKIPNKYEPEFFADRIEIERRESILPREFASALIKLKPELDAKRNTIDDEYQNELKKQKACDTYLALQIAAEVASKLTGTLVSAEMLHSSREIFVTFRDLYDYILEWQPTVVKEVAVKQFYSASGDFSEFVFLSTCKHNNIIPLTEYYSSKLLPEIEPTMAIRLYSCPLIITDWMTHGTLEDYLFSKTYLTVQEISHICEQILSGLDYLHSTKVVHLDMKPQNVFLDKNAHVLLADFGIAAYKTNTYIPSYNQELKGAGTAGYKAPEILKGILNYSNDIFAFGFILYFMLSKLHPFEKDTTQIDRIVNGARPELNPSWNHVFIKMIHKSWQTDPSKRPKSTELLDMLATAEQEVVEAQVASKFISGQTVELLNVGKMIGTATLQYQFPHSNIWQVKVLPASKQLLLLDSCQSWDESDMKLVQDQPNVVQ